MTQGSVISSRIGTKFVMVFLSNIFPSTDKDLIFYFETVYLICGHAWIVNIYTHCWVNHALINKSVQGSF